jgi:hypothetical protein
LCDITFTYYNKHTSMRTLRSIPFLRTHQNSFGLLMGMAPSVLPTQMHKYTQYHPNVGGFSLASLTVTRLDIRS